MNNLRTRNGEPNNFEDGLAVRGILLDGSMGAKAVAMKIQESDPIPTSLFDWVRATMLSLKTLSDAGGGKVADQPLTDISDKAANTKFVQLLAAEMLLKIAGGTNLPVGLDSLAEFATAMGNDPQFLTKINDALATKVGIEDLRYTTANSCVAGGGPNAISGAFIPAIKTLVGEPVIYVRSLGANTVPDPTFTPNLGVISADVIVKSNNQPLLPGDIPGANYPMMLRRDSSLQKWVLMNPAGASNLPWASNDVTTAGLSTNTVVSPASLKATLAQILGTAPDVLNSFAEIATALKNDPHAIDTILAKIAALAPVQSPVFTDSPKAPTQPLASNDASLATTAFVWAAITQALTNSLKASTQTISGIIRLCTNPEVLAMLNDTAAVTPATLRYWFDNLPAATSTDRSTVRFASSDESFTGLLEDVAVNPKGMRFAIDQALSQFVGGLTAPTTPALTGSSTVVVGLSYTLTLTSQPTTGGATVTSFDLTLNNGAVQTLPATAGSATYTWTSSGTVGQTVTFRVKAKDSNNKVSAEASKVVTLSTITVNPVVMVSPTVDQLARPLVGTFIVNAISFSGGTSTHLNTDWDLRTAANGGGTSLWSSLNDTVNKTSIAYSLASVVTPGTKYYLRVRQKTQNYGDSGWTEVGFTYIARPGAPTLSGAGSVISGQAFTLAMSSPSLEAGATASQFLISVNGGAEVQIAATSNSGTYVWTSSGVAGTTASLAVRVLDSNGLYSDPSTKAVSLTTVSINTPTFISPANDATGISVSPTLRTTDMTTTGGQDSFASTDWEARTAPGGGGVLLWDSLADSVNKTSITIPVGKIGASTLVYFRARYRGAVYGVSDWAEISTTTMGAPGAPALSGSAGFRPGDNYVLTMSANPVLPATAITSFSVVVGTEAPVVVSSVNNSANWTYSGASNATVTPGQAMVISVTALDNANLVSSAGTKSLTSSKPKLPMYSGPTTGLSISPSFTASAMVMDGLASAHLSTDWELRTGPSGAGTLAASAYDSSSAKLEWIPPAASLANAATYYLRSRQKSQDFGASNWMEVQITTAPKPASATLSGSNTHYLGLPYSLTVTASATSPATSVVSFDVVVDGGAPTTVAASLNSGVYSGTYVWPVSAMATKIAGQTVVFSVVLKDNTGAISNPSSKSVGIAAAAISTPSFIYPTASQTGLTESFTATTSDFSISGGGATHASSDWKLVRVSDNVTVDEVVGVTGTKLKLYSPPAGAISPNTAYVLQVKYNSSTNQSSSWGQVSFTSAASGAPSIISPTNGQVGAALTVVVYSSSFIGGGGNTHSKSSWELRTQANGGGVLIDSLVDSTSALTQWSIPGVRDPGVQYYLRVKHQGSLSGYSPWGESSFVTGSAETPVISSPLNNSTKNALIPTFTIADLVALVSGDTHLFTEWEVRTESLGAGSLVANSTTTGISIRSWTPTSALVGNAVFYLRARIKTQLFGLSGWKEIKFSTGYVVAPVIVSPASGELGLYPNSVNVALAPMVIQGTDTPKSTTYLLHTGTSQSGSLIKSVTTTTQLSSIVLNQFDVDGSIGPLKCGVMYYLTVMHTGTLFGDSLYSTAAFTTGQTGTPTWVSPAVDDEQNYALNSVVSVNPGSVSGKSDVILNYTIEYRTGASGSGSVAHAATMSGSSYTPPTGSLQPATSYWIRVRANYENYGPSIWIERKINTANSVTPRITSPALGEINLDPGVLIKSSPFGILGTTHLSSSWRVSTSSDMAAIVDTSPNNTVSKTAWRSSLLLGSTKYWVQVMHHGANGVSTSWSDSVSFTTGATTLTSANATVVNTIVPATGLLRGVATDKCGTWVVVGYSTATSVGSILTSHDNGVTWKDTTPIEQSVSLDAGLCTTVRFLNGKFLLGHTRIATSNTLYTNRILSSATGEDWKVVYSDVLTATEISDFATDGIVTIGTGLFTGLKYPVSTDGGATFALATLGIAEISAVNNYSWFNVIYSETLDLFIATGNEGTYWSSTGLGSSWTECTGPATFAVSVATASVGRNVVEFNGVIYATTPSTTTVSTSVESNLHKSVDGKVFTKVTNPPFGSVAALYVIGNYLYALCSPTTANAGSVFLGRTKNAVTWESMSVVSTIKTDAAVGPGLTVLVGYGTTTATTSGGLIKLPNFNDPEIDSPTLTGSTTMTPGGLYSLSITGVTVAGDEILSFDLSKDGGALVNVPAVNSSGGYTTSGSDTSTKNPGSVLGFSVTTNYASGATSSPAKKFVLITGVARPQILTPTYQYGSQALTGACSAAAFVCHGPAVTHLASDWEIWTAAGGTGTNKVTITASTTAKTSWSIPSGKLANSTAYYLRTRHKASDGTYGPWAEVKFTTVAVATPSPPASTGPTFYGNDNYVLDMLPGDFVKQVWFEGLSCPAGSACQNPGYTTGIQSGSFALTFVSTDGVTDYYQSTARVNLGASAFADYTTNVTVNGVWRYTPPGGSQVTVGNPSS